MFGLRWCDEGKGQAVHLDHPGQLRILHLDINLSHIVSFPLRLVLFSTLSFRPEDTVRVP